jgi:hypothetical protein
MKAGVISCLVTFVTGCVLAVLQMWFALMPAEVFAKVMITLGIVFVVMLGITLVRREYLEDQSLRQSGHLE